MQHNSNQTPDADTSTKLSVENNSPRFGTKRDVAAMLQLSVRSIDNLISSGMPHCKLGLRRCRFDLPEVFAWFKSQYSVQRIGKAGSK